MTNYVDSDQRRNEDGMATGFAVMLFSVGAFAVHSPVLGALLFALGIEVFQHYLRAFRRWKTNTNAEQN
jgi:hypothetical protein